MFVTVAICTHNPKPHYLAKVIESLRTQSLGQQAWELLLVDNASTNQLPPSANLDWHCNGRIIREEQLGLTHARLRAIREGRGDLFVFVDDDNVLDTNFLERTLDIAHKREYIGAWSGQCHPGFDIQPAAWTRRYWGMLVVREFEQAYWSNLPMLADTMPCGAGLCVRRTVAHTYLSLHDSGKRPMLLDRRGSSLMSGGDNDLAACACDIGLGVGLFPELELTHLIPENRTTADYLTKLAEGIHYSAIYLRSLRGESTIKPSRKRRILQLLQGLKMQAIDRRIFWATCRGENRALHEIGL